MIIISITYVCLQWKQWWLLMITPWLFTFLMTLYSDFYDLMFIFSVIQCSIFRKSMFIFSVFYNIHFQWLIHYHNVRLLSESSPPEIYRTIVDRVKPSRDCWPSNLYSHLAYNHFLTKTNILLISSYYAP